MILAGTAGLVIPVMPGWVLITAGFVVLAPGSRLAEWIKRTLRRLADKARRKKDSV